MKKPAVHKPERNRRLLEAAAELLKDAEALEIQSAISVVAMRRIAADLIDMTEAPARAHRVGDAEAEPEAPAPARFTREQLETMAAPLNAEQKAIFWEKWSPELDPAGVL
jgi:hypothetical protein